MRQADHIVILTTAQFTPKNKPTGYTEGKKTGQQHALVGSPNGPHWLTVPVANKRQPIKDTLLAQGDWRQQFLATLTHSYAKAPYFEDMLAEVKEFINTDSLGDLNTTSTIMAAYMIGCHHKVYLDTSFQSQATKGDWMLELCQEADADTYICGAPSLDYLDPQQWADADIQVIPQNWTCPPYKQVFKQFQPNLSWWDAYAHLGRQGLADLFT
jgi:hypothetical protein